MERNKELLISLYQDNLKEITDKLKIQIFDKLIELSEKRPQGMLFKEELIIIRDGVEEARNKRKDEEIKAIGDVLENLVQRFGKEKDFDDKLDKELAKKSKTVKKGCGVVDGFGKRCGDDAESSDGIEERMFCPDCEEKSNAEPKEGEKAFCNEKDCNGSLTWVCLGEPEGDFYKCDECDGEFNKDFKPLDEEKSETEDFGVHNGICGISCSECKEKSKDETEEKE